MNVGNAGAFLFAGRMNVTNIYTTAKQYTMPYVPNVGQLQARMDNNNSALIEYGSAVVDGRIPACDKIRRVYSQRLDAIQKPGKYHFDLSYALPHIEFMETFCRQSIGEMGAALELQQFQRAKFEIIFGFIDDDGYRQYNESLTIEGRKNGKTTESSAVAYDMLMNDGEGAPEIYFIATSREQASKGYNECCNMRLQSPLLSKYIRKRKSDLWFAGNLGFIKALSSNTNSLDGLNTHLCIVDELAAIKNRDTYDLMKQSIAAMGRKQPLIYCISTNGFVRECIFDAQYEYAEKVIADPSVDEHFLPLIYELDRNDDWRDPDVWEKANPGLGTIKSYEVMEGFVNKAINDSSFRPTVLVKDFNRKENNASAWLTYNEVHNEEIFPEYKFGYCIGGMDAADSVDLAAAKALCMRPDDDHIYVRQMYWMPEDKVEELCAQGSRRERDNAPYKLWIAEGLMRTCPGKKVNKYVFLEWFKELRDTEDLWVLHIGYDPWHIDDTLKMQFDAEFGDKCLIPVIQGTKTMSDPMKEYKADLQNKRFIRKDRKIDEWCMMNAAVRTDINNNIQLIKNGDSRMRIDGLAAELDAYIVLKNKFEEYQSLI